MRMMKRRCKMDYRLAVTRKTSCNDVCPASAARIPSSISVVMPPARALPSISASVAPAEIM